MRFAVLVSLALTGCYRPGAEVSCTVQCNAAQPCEGAMNCERGLCRDPLAPACSNDAGLADSDAVKFDAPIPAGCWGSLPHRYCQAPAPTGMLDINTSTTINTDTDSRCIDDSTYPYCVIAFQDIVIRATVTGYGLKPLMFVATNALTITQTGEVDVSALGFTAGGPGAGGGSCTAGSQVLIGTTSSGGGAGGTFAGIGGQGGAGDTAGGVPGEPAIPNPTAVRGGCAGSTGGGVPGGGLAGFGGGAVVLIAGGTLSAHGSVLARGAGGGGGGPTAGGGGGGSGGMIVLDGMQVIVSGSLIAGGAGGGGGGSSGAGGSDGTVTLTSGAPGEGGAGGLANRNTGDLGHGGGGSGTLSPLDGQNGFLGGVGFGGGGGGGGAGVIWVRGTFTNQGATIVPPRT